MKILLLGSSGFLGNEIYSTFKSVKKFSLFHNGVKKKIYDLKKKNNLEKLIVDSKPDLIINCLGYTDVDLCEKNKISSFINVTIVKNIFLIKKKYKLNFKFLHFSSDQVYDSRYKTFNKENSKTKTNNKYTQQKLNSEKICLKNNALIFRTNFFGKSKSGTPSLTDWIFQKFKQKKRFYLFNDIFFNPLRVSTIAKIILKIVLSKKSNKSGIYNLCAKDFLNKSTFAIQFAKKAGIYKKNYIIISSNKILKTPRSKNMIMCHKKFLNTFKIQLPSIDKEIKCEAKKYK